MSTHMYDTLSLPIILAWVRANLAKILLGGAVFALFAIPFVISKQKTYESEVMLLISPPTFKEERSTEFAQMMPQTLPVEAYRAIALTPSLLSEVRERVQLDTSIRMLQERLNVELVQRGSRTHMGIAYTQALTLKAKAQSPEMAAQIAQTWAESFKERVDMLSTQGIRDTFTILAEWYNRSKKELEQAEFALGEHQKGWNLALIEAQLKAKQQQFTSFDENLKQFEVQLASEQMRLSTLEKELADEPRKEAFFRAPSDDAYWIAAAQAGSDPNINPDQGLLTEQSNPNYVSTRAMVIQVREQTEGVRARKQATSAKLAELNEEIEALLTTLTDQTIARDTLTRETESYRRTYDSVRAEYDKSRMANHAQATYIVLTGDAVTPQQESGIPNTRLLIFAAFFGVVLTGGFLALKEISELSPAPAKLQQTASKSKDEPAKTA